MKRVSAAESYPGEVDLATGKLTLFPVDGGKASVRRFRLRARRQSVYFISDEPLRGVAQEFQTCATTTRPPEPWTVLSAPALPGTYRLHPGR
jgi:hypothetical protein